MDCHISLFGGGTRFSVSFGTGREETIEISRDVWFDRDIDGRWLVWVQERGDREAASREEAPIGAIVVRNKDAIMFIEQLGRLMVEPAAFEHEPVFSGADSESEHASS